MQLRRATTDDAAAVADVFLRSRRASVPAIPPLVHDDQDVRRHVAEAVVPVCETWVAVDGEGGVVGFLALSDGWVEHLYVDPDRTGRGIGAALLAVAMRERPGGLDLWTFQSNAGARRFYERHRFVAVAETDGDNEEGAPDVRYRWHR